MKRTLDIEIVQTSWPSNPPIPVFPPTFHSGTTTQDINILALLLEIGYLTTPTSATGVSLSEFWAWVRYLSAITQDQDIRITSSFSSLDAHQKTILSDDFGMGVPMLWLKKALSFQKTVDGNYFIQKVAASINAKGVKTGKRGPNKTPDFVSVDNNGVWHVVECKGTQSGLKYLNNQLGINGQNNTGGVIQKKSITFPPGYTGQRLACGLSIGLEGKSSSLLKIVDPEPEEPFAIEKKDIVYAQDAMIRGTVSKLLRLSGLEVTAERIAAPLGITPDVTPFKSRTADVKRQELVSDRERSSIRELKDFAAAFRTNNNHFSYRVQEFVLPREILVEGRWISKVTVQQRLNLEFIDMLTGTSFNEEPIHERIKELNSLMTGDDVRQDDFSAAINYGGILESEMILNTK
ncbi:hypothetical protein ACQV2E_13565 [Pantoea allii]|uniref:Uncharacterized protein n=1 Tax=Pantoea allii TaxID=574096 RepID=A0ABS6VHC4_9GAMM|nr:MULTISPECIES: hypothetical protein [Pantoea]MBW1215544.1 hypothetical protein [Pantoea allii]MBW1258729.1 hypothetical protein [Pantoea allii]MBW1267413.1 hypothetical protein [Pantoea allii]MBW1289821.1 hypothetical protein [Pantoea allii]